MCAPLPLPSHAPRGALGKRFHARQGFTEAKRLSEACKVCYMQAGSLFKELPHSAGRAGKVAPIRAFKVMLETQCEGVSWYGRQI